MSKNTVLTVIGARPQFIKAATTSRAFLKLHSVQERIVHTGQHYDFNMSDVFFGELGIPKPHYHLGIGGGSHGEMTGRMLAGIEAIMVEERPDLVLLFGDTNSTLAGALAASKLQIPIAHVEAGLRSFNKAMPEEINRILTDHCADLLFSPTATATRNLFSEGISGPNVIEVGDVMFDAALMFGEVAKTRSTVMVPGEPYVLSTIHRQENTDSPARLEAIMRGLAMVAEEIPVVLPIHPRTRSMLPSWMAVSRPANLHMIDPVGYLDMVSLQKHASVIATDSGGVQKEAFFHAVPCVTLRDETEWTELVDAGWNRLVSPDSPKAVRKSILAARGQRGAEIAPYGRGNASGRIAELIEAFLR